MRTDYQKIIFDEIKRQIGGNESLGNAIGDILNISQDAVYRRFRGETLLTIFELEKLCKHFHISLDGLFEINKNTVSFRFQPLESYDFSMDVYLEKMLNDVKTLKSQKNPKLILTINNIPLLQLLNYPHLVRFKLFFWAKTYLQLDEYKNVPFSYQKISEKSFATGMEILKVYNSIPSIEIYDKDFLRGLAREIFSAYDSREFEDPQYALKLYETMDKFITHLKDQMDIGQKYVATTSPPADGNEFDVYLDDISNLATTIYYQTDDLKGLYIAHNFMNTLHTNDTEYLNDTENVINRQINNSILISKSNDKERNKFIADLRAMIDLYRKKIMIDLAQ